MRTPIYQVDAFASRRFAGNPAAVMPMERFPADELMQAIAAENNLAETAFLVPLQEEYRLRWFTPTVEVPLCGHATLASAAVVMEKLQPERDSVVFQTVSGPLRVRRLGTRYAMDFPARLMAPLSPFPQLAQALGAVPREVWADAFSYLVLLDNARSVRELTPDLAGMERLEKGGVIVTAPGDQDYDFVSRCFAPARGIPEDPVTGGAHCALAPYWAARLGKTRFHAYQASRRGGELTCEWRDDRVELQGSCVFYLQGMVEIG